MSTPPRVDIGQLQMSKDRPGRLQDRPVSAKPSPRTDAGRRLLHALGGTSDETYESPTARMIREVEHEAWEEGRADLRRALQNVAEGRP